MNQALKTTLKRVPSAKQLIAMRDRSAAQRKVREQFDTFVELASGKDERFALEWDERWVCLGDDVPRNGFDRHYLYHMAWAARKVADRMPTRHHDFSSHLHFASLVSAFVPTTLYEFRPPALELDRLTTDTADLTDLPMPDGSLDSVSTMHVVEHLGLGRYGDPLRPDADLAAMRELTRVLAPGGDLYFVVPVGKPRLAFNGCRVYSYQQITDYFSALDLAGFALIEDDEIGGALIPDADPGLVAKQTYACGCFHFRKPRESPPA